MHVKNVSSDQLCISAASNLSQQVFVFSDLANETPANDMLMRAGETNEIFVAVRILYSISIL
jgi:hypothetical protein